MEAKKEEKAEKLPRQGQPLVKEEPAKCGQPAPSPQLLVVSLAEEAATASLVSEWLLVVPSQKRPRQRA